MKRSDSPWWSAGFTKQWWDDLDRQDRELFLDSLTDEELESFHKDWRVWGRDNQLAPEGIWTTWLLLAGRGFGKTRSLVEFFNDQVWSGTAGRIALVGQGEDDIREVLIEGESGFLNTARSDRRPVFRPAVGSGRLIWPNGAMAYVYSAADPESLRGPQFDLAGFDEPMAVPAENRQKTVQNLKYGLRLGSRPRLVYATTPKPHRWLREEMEKIRKAAVDKATGGILPNHLRKYVLTKGSTKDNAENLPESFIEGILDDYDGTNLGRQEIYAEILGEEEGALWTPEVLDRNRIIQIPQRGPERLEYLQAFCATCDEVVIGVDPNTTAASKTAHEAGVIVAARRGRDRFIVEDRSCGGGPAKWARAAITAYEDFGAKFVVPEVNQGGDMVKMVIQQEANEQGVDVAVRMVRASKGKQRRAEPVAAAYERGMVKHLGDVGSIDRPGPFFKLETQMCALHDAHDPTGEDFDRCDAAVWALTRLGVKKSTSSGHGDAAGILTFGDFVNADG